MKIIKIILVTVIFFLLIFNASTSSTYGDTEKRELDVERDKDKTVYIIGGTTNSRQRDQTEEDRQNSWDMLKNTRIKIDKKR
ncbi:MAG: hypothetical protein KBE27_01470 [Syntrophorhabdaceae bacterium]|nr:hypothetical protein [Syntrophorhabdaceae bacterium]